MSITAIEMAIRDLETDKKFFEILIKLFKKELNKLPRSDKTNAFERGFKSGLIQAYEAGLKKVTENITNITKQYEIEKDDEE